MWLQRLWLEVKVVRGPAGRSVSIWDRHSGTSGNLKLQPHELKHHVHRSPISTMQSRACNALSSKEKRYVAFL